jgi:hypothetical protein
MIESLTLNAYAKKTIESSHTPFIGHPPFQPAKNLAVKGNLASF